MVKIVLYKISLLIFYYCIGISIIINYILDNKINCDIDFLDDIDVYSLDRLYRNITDYLKISDKVNFIFVKDNIDTEKDKAFIPIMKFIDEKYIEYRKKEKTGENRDWY